MQPMRHRILCVDDDLDFCQMMSVWLEMDGFEAVFAHSANEGLNQARKESFSLITLDGRYPDGTGLELCRQIRQFDTVTPVLFFSGRSGNGIEQMAEQAGAQGYLVKPTDFDRLRETIRTLVD